MRNALWSLSLLMVACGAPAPGTGSKSLDLQLKAQNLVLHWGTTWAGSEDISGEGTAGATCSVTGSRSFDLNLVTVKGTGALAGKPGSAITGQLFAIVGGNAVESVSKACTSGAPSRPCNQTAPVATASFNLALHTAADWEDATPIDFDFTPPDGLDSLTDPNCSVPFSAPVDFLISGKAGSAGSFRDSTMAKVVAGSGQKTLTNGMVSGTLKWDLTMELVRAN